MRERERVPARWIRNLSHFSCMFVRETRILIKEMSLVCVGETDEDSATLNLRLEEWTNRKKGRGSQKIVFKPLDQNQSRVKKIIKTYVYLSIIILKIFKYK